jgi:ubiquinone biosynthesis protein
MRETYLNRYRQLAEVLARHGLGYLAGAFGLERFAPLQQAWLGRSRRGRPYTRPEHVRVVLEGMGGTFIKLGQILSTRADPLSPEYLTELAKLQDATPPVAGRGRARESG